MATVLGIIACLAVAGGFLYFCALGLNAMKDSQEEEERNGWNYNEERSYNELHYSSRKT